MHVIRSRRPLLISHELSRSGAPIALLSMAKALQEMGHHPIVTYLRDGPLKEDYRAAGIEITQRVYPDEVSLVIGNTVFAAPVAQDMGRRGIPAVAWVHEPLYFLSTLNVPIPAMGLGQLDAVLAPARFLLEDLAPHGLPARVFELWNTVDQPDYLPEPRDDRFAVTGAWTPYKSQADLLELVRATGIDARFLFVGATCPPELEGSPSIAHHEFTGSLSPMDAKRAIARCRALVSASRSEVQPLTSIEAVMAGRPALVSDIPGHRALAGMLPNMILFDRGSPESFMSGWTRLQTLLEDETLARMASTRAHTLFGRDAFKTRLEAIMQCLLHDRCSSVSVSQDA